MLTWATERDEHARPVPVDRQYVSSQLADRDDSNHKAVAGIKHGDPAGCGSAGPLRLHLYEHLQNDITQATRSL